MDALQIVVTIATVLFGSGGVVTFLRARKSRQAGLPETETAVQKAISPDWDSLTAYYKKELESLRGDLRQELEGVRRQVTQLTRKLEAKDLYIDLLRDHIYRQLPPPPPEPPPFFGDPI